MNRERSQRIMEVLSNKAKPLTTQAASLDLTGYLVITGEKTGYMYVDSGNAGVQPIEPWDWMEKVRLSAPSNAFNYATFYFPDDHVGPDIIFALRSPGAGATKIVLCLLQVSTSIPTQNLDLTQTAVEVRTIRVRKSHRRHRSQSSIREPKEPRITSRASWLPEKEGSP